VANSIKHTSDFAPVGLRLVAFDEAETLDRIGSIPCCTRSRTSPRVRAWDEQIDAWYKRLIVRTWLLWHRFHCHTDIEPERERNDENSNNGCVERVANATRRSIERHRITGVVG
jgi:hypothetical protein